MGIPTPREIQERILRENHLIEFLQREMELREVKISLLRQLVQINEQLIEHLNSDPRLECKDNCVCALCHSDGRGAWQAHTDARCVTTTDGACIGTSTCMHSPPDLGEYTLPFGYRYGCRHPDHEGCHVHPNGTYWHHPTDTPACPL